MSLSKPRSLEEALAQRHGSNANPMISHHVFASGEDFIVSCVNETNKKDKSHFLLDIDDKLSDKCLSRESDFKLTKIT